MRWYIRFSLTEIFQMEYVKYKKANKIIWKKILLTYYPQKKNSLPENKNIGNTHYSSETPGCGSLCRSRLWPMH